MDSILSIGIGNNEILGSEKLISWVNFQMLFKCAVAIIYLIDLDGESGEDDEKG